MLMRHRPGTGLDVEVLSVADMRAAMTDWDDLCRRSLEDTVYYAPSYATALLDTVAKRDRVRFVSARKSGKLVALLPVVQAGLPVPGLIATGQAWTTPYTFSTLPLIDRDMAVDAAAALIEGLRALGQGEWTLPAVNFDGPCCRALTDALEGCGIPWAAAGVFERAALSSGPSFEEHMTAAIGNKRRRELARNRRRLEELGEVTHEAHIAGDGLKHAVRAFLDLEASGWKGERGTALLCDPVTRDFALAAFGGNGGRCRADLLKLNGKPIAAGMIVFSGETGFTVKGAYDEAYARYSAGLLLEVEVIRSFLSEGWARRLDAATAGAHVIDRLWPARMRIGNLVFSLARQAPAHRLRCHMRTAELMGLAKRGAKRLLRR